MAEQPQYRVNRQSYIGHSLVEEGATVTYDAGPNGHISDNLSPLNAAAQAVVDAQAKPHPDKKPAKAEKPAKGKGGKPAEPAEDAEDVVVDTALPDQADADDMS